MVGIIIRQRPGVLMCTASGPSVMMKPFILTRTLMTQLGFLIKMAGLILQF